MEFMSAALFSSVALIFLLIVLPYLLLPTRCCGVGYFLLQESSEVR